MPITPEKFCMLYPRLYHMAQAGSWHSIQRLGLLSTTALLDLFEINGKSRMRIESQHRPECVDITHPKHGTATIRDQKPMSEKALQKCLRGTTPQEWYELLNRRVFFWVTEERVSTLLGARAYKKHEHDVLTVDSAGILEQYAKHVTLCPINSGSTVYNPQPRGRDTFQPFAKYPFEHRKKYGKRAIAEMAVDYAVPDARNYVLRVERRAGSRILEVLFERQ
jgi:hypothetical protein